MSSATSTQNLSTNIAADLGQRRLYFRGLQLKAAWTGRSRTMQRPP